MSLVVNMSFIYFELRLLTVLNIAVSNPVEQKKKTSQFNYLYVFCKTKIANIFGEFLWI